MVVAGTREAVVDSVVTTGGEEGEGEVDTEVVEVEEEAKEGGLIRR